MWHIVLTVNGYGISADDDTTLHKVLCSSVIIYEEKKFPMKPGAMQAY